VISCFECGQEINSNDEVQYVSEEGKVAHEGCLS